MTSGLLLREKREINDESHSFVSERGSICASDATVIYGSWGQSCLCHEWMTTLCAGLVARASHIWDGIDQFLRGLSLRTMDANSRPDDPAPPEIDPSPGGDPAAKATN